jgi:hypothetical protein
VQEPDGHSYEFFTGRDEGPHGRGAR